jgi:alanine racemase
VTLAAGDGVRSRHRAWIEVDHGAIRANLAALRRLAGADKQVIAVVKADAYGHGSVEVARTLAAAGVERLAVATVGEALELRGAGIELPILVSSRPASRRSPTTAPRSRRSRRRPPRPGAGPRSS